MEEKNLFLRMLSLRVWAPWFSFLGGVCVEGDKSVIPQNRKGWRDEWKWVVFKTEHFSSRYHMYVETEGKRMRYLRPLNTHYVAVRVGPDMARFKAIEALHGGTAELPLIHFLGPLTREEMRYEFDLAGINRDDVSWI